MSETPNTNFLVWSNQVNALEPASIETQTINPLHENYNSSALNNLKSEVHSFNESKKTANPSSQCKKSLIEPETDKILHIDTRFSNTKRESFEKDQLGKHFQPKSMIKAMEISDHLFSENTKSQHSVIGFLWNLSSSSFQELSSTSNQQPSIKRTAKYSERFNSIFERTSQLLTELKTRLPPSKPLSTPTKQAIPGALRPYIVNHSNKFDPLVKLTSKIEANTLPNQEISYNKTSSNNKENQHDPDVVSSNKTFSPETQQSRPLLSNNYQSIVSEENSKTLSLREDLSSQQDSLSSSETRAKGAEHATQTPILKASSSAKILKMVTSSQNAFSSCEDGDSSRYACVSSERLRGSMCRNEEPSLACHQTKQSPFNSFNARVYIDYNDSCIGGRKASTAAFGRSPDDSVVKNSSIGAKETQKEQHDLQILRPQTSFELDSKPESKNYYTHEEDHQNFFQRRSSIQSVTQCQQRLQAISQDAFSQLPSCSLETAKQGISSMNAIQNCSTVAEFAQSNTLCKEQTTSDSNVLKEHSSTTSKLSVSSCASLRPSRCNSQQKSGSKTQRRTEIIRIDFDVRSGKLSEAAPFTTSHLYQQPTHCQTEQLLPSSCSKQTDGWKGPSRLNIETLRIARTKSSKSSVAKKLTDFEVYRTKFTTTPPSRVCATRQIDPVHTQYEENLARLQSTMKANNSARKIKPTHKKAKSLSEASQNLKHAELRPKESSSEEQNTMRKAIQTKGPFVALGKGALEQHNSSHRCSLNSFQKVKGPNCSKNLKKSASSSNLRSQTQQRIQTGRVPNADNDSAMYCTHHRNRPRNLSAVKLEIVSYPKTVKSVTPGRADTPDVHISKKPMQQHSDIRECMTRRSKSQALSRTSNCYRIESKRVQGATSTLLSPALSLNNLTDSLSTLPTVGVIAASHSESMHDLPLQSSYVAEYNSCVQEQDIESNTVQYSGCHIDKPRGELDSRLCRESKAKKHKRSSSSACSRSKTYAATLKHNSNKGREARGMDSLAYCTLSTFTRSASIRRCASRAGLTPSKN